MTQDTRREALLPPGARLVSGEADSGLDKRTSVRYHGSMVTTPLALPPADLEALGRSITELSAHISAAKARLAAMVGEFDARKGWGEWGVLSCEHWLEVRCGHGPGEARETVR